MTQEAVEMEPHETASDWDQPVYSRYFADPFVWQAEGCYYAVGTSRPAAGQQHLFALLRSPDLRSWEELGGALVPPDPLLGKDFWAPEVACHNGTYYMYYSVGFGDKHHHIRVAVSDSPAGPFRDTGTSLTTPETVPFAIDGHPFRDDDGQWYLYQCRDFLERDADGEVGTGLVVDRLEGMTRLVGDLRVVMRPRHCWQLFQARRHIYGRVADWHTLEGPNVVKHEGRYYCLFSGGCWKNETYGVDYVVADHPMGPWRQEGGESGPRILRTIPGRIIGPGHNSTVIGPDGTTRYIVYHAWDLAHTGRYMRIAALAWTADGPRLAP